MIDEVNLIIGEGVEAKSGVLYENLQTLGVGGNATTFLVLATSGHSKGVPFAMKAFRRHSKPERRDSFLREVDFLKSCSHPSIMRVFDDGVLPGGSPFIIAEYLPHTLDEAVVLGRITTAEKACYTLQLLSALSYLATLDPPVIHRDIKPQNVFVKGHSCVLGDFGLLKHEAPGVEDDRNSLKESLGVGMPFRYRTPDLVDYLNRGVRPTCKSDVYQLGLVAAELFTGRNPQRPARKFDARIVLDPLRAIPGTAMAGVISDLIREMLIEDPDRREPAAKFLDAWQGVFLDAARNTHALEGKVF